MRPSVAILLRVFPESAIHIRWVGGCSTVILAPYVYPYGVQAGAHTGFVSIGLISAGHNIK
jgi:hypothetical protein